MATNIFAAYAQPVRSVQDYSNEMARGDYVAGQNALMSQQVTQGRLATQEAQRRQNALQAVISGWTPDTPADAKVGALQRAGLLTEAAALQKQETERARGVADVGKTTADAAKTSGETRDATFKMYRSQLDYIESPQAAARWLQAQYQDPVTGPILAAIKPFEEAVQSVPTDPAQYQQWRVQAGVGMEKVQQWAKERELAKLQSDTTIRGQDVSAATQRRGQDISASTTIRGQNLTDARSRDANTSTITKPFEVTGPDGVPILVRQDKQGNISRVEGFGPKAGAAKPLNDTQAKALLFGSRMQASGKILSDLEDKGVLRPGSISQSAQTAAGMVPFIGDKLADVAGTATNWTQSPEQQSVEQARRDFINAVLRRESGAVISPAEFANAEKQYFPVVGNPPELIAQKRRNRELATRGLMAEVPQGQRDSITKAPPNAGVTVDWGDLK